MGAANLVEFRRMELAAISGREHEEVSGEEVAESFLSAAIEPDGFYREYLAHAQIAVTIGDTVRVILLLLPPRVCRADAGLCYW